MIRRLLVVLAVVLAGAATLPAAGAHASPAGSTPTGGAVLAAAPARDVREPTAESGAPAGVGTALSVARLVRYLGIGGATGLLVLALAVWAPLRRRGTLDDEADDAFSAAAGRALRAFALAGVAGSLAALVLLGAVAGGTGVGDALRPGALADVAGTRTGAWLLAGAVASALLAVVAGRAVRAPRGLRGPGGRPAALAALLVLVLLAAPAFGGHAWAASPSWALVPIQIVHVAGMGAWLGGLLGVLLALPGASRTRPAGRERHALLAAVLLRFSPVALVSVGVLTAAGTGLALLQLTSLYDLTDTAYGRAVFVKVALLVGAIWVAVVQREYLLPRLRRLADGEEPATEGADRDGADPEDDEDEARRPPSADTGRHVRLALRAEVVLLVVVLAATGALAGYPPPGSLDRGPVTVTRQAGGAELQLTVDPARVGSNVMHLYASGRDGQPVRGARELRVRAVPPGRSGGSDVPVDVRFVRSGPGHWTAPEVPLGTRGEWSVEVGLRLPAGGRAEADLPVRVR